MPFVTSTVLMLVVCVTTLTPAQTKEEPGAFYLRYRATVPTATSMEQILEFWDDHLVKSYTTAAPIERVGLDELKKVYAAHTDVKVVMRQVSVSGGIGPPRWSTSTTTLGLEGLTADKVRVVGSVRLGEKDGAWKVAALEQWEGPSR